MKTKTQLTTSTIFLIFVLCLSLINVNPVLADDAPPTEPPSATEQPTEPPTEEATAIPELVTDTPAPESGLAGDAPAKNEETSVEEVLSEIPDNTDVMILDENGNPVSLASQEAVEILEEADPMWCPQGVLPNGPGCTTNLTVTALLTLMRTNAGGVFSANGVIYFERSGLTIYNTSFILDNSLTSLGASYNTIRAFNITLRGGWNGGATNTFDATESSVFDNDNNAVVRLGSSGNPWIGNITIQDIRIQDNDNNPGTNNGPSLSVYTTTGNITLNDVDVVNQGGTSNATVLNTAILNSNSGGNIVVQNGSSFDGNISGNNQSRGFSATTNTGSITITDTTFTDARGCALNTCVVILDELLNYNGATLSAPTVTLTNVTANNNDLSGIRINNANLVTLNNVTATNNGTLIVGSGIYVAGTGSTIVNVTGGTFSNNEPYGIYAEGISSLNYLSPPTCSGNLLPLANFSLNNCDNIPDTTPPVITFVNRTPANGNGWNNADVTVQWSCTDDDSGVVNASVSQTVTTEGANQSATGTCQDRAGNTASNTQTGINIDKTAPTASASRLPAPNANGWNNTDVTVTFSGTDTNSGIASCTAPITRTANGSGQSASGNCTDLAGNVSSTVTLNNINIDKTLPVIAFVSRTPANGNGWNNGNVTVQWSCTDALSGVVSAAVSQTVSTEGANQSTTGTCTDLAGNTATNTQSGINIDKTAPTLNLPANVLVEATGPAGANVNYSALANDNLDSSPTLNCLPASGGVYPFGTTPVTCTATDHAGNTSAPSSFSITVQDTTPPAIDPVANMSVDTLNIKGKKVTYSSPATSDIVDGPGIATCTPDSESFFVIGNNYVTCSATDLHGNTAFVSFVIEVNENELSTTTTSGFFIPATGGSSVKLNCAPPDSFIISMARARIIFNNLCDYEAFINNLQLLELPGELPSGSGFVDGYSINISEDGKLVSPLPKGASVAIEFNIPNGKKDADFGVLYWNSSQWTAIAGEMIDGHFIVDITAKITNSNTFIFVTK